MKEIKIEKKKVVFEQTPPEEVYLDYFDFDEELSFVGGCICGNRDLKSFGNEDLISIAMNNYEDDELGYDYEPLEMLKKKTGNEYVKVELCGYCQRDWNYLYLPKESATDEYIDYIESFYFGKVDEYYNEDYFTIPILHSLSWKGPDKIKQVISEETGLSVDEIAIKEFKGYKKVAQYEEAI